MSLTDNTYRNLFYCILIIVLSILLYSANSLSISYNEALNYFVNTSLLSIITNTSTYIFGQDDIALRLPFLVCYLLSVVLMFNLTENFFKKSSDRFISIVIFMLLPGMLSASLLVNSAIIVTFLILLYLYHHKKTGTHSYILLILFLIVDNSFAIFFLALFFYGIKEKDKKLYTLAIVLFILSMSIYGFKTEGKPRGFLVDTFAIYASIFSPLLFLYFFYAIYRNAIKGEKSLVWYIATTSLIFSFLFSFRQKISIEDYAPFVIIFLPYMTRIFFHSVRVRLPQFRYRHYYTASLVLFILFANIFFTIVNKPIYLILKEPHKHFIYKYSFIKEIAEELKKNKIYKVESDDKKLLLRLKFYGIEKGNEYYISTKKQYYYDQKFSIDYFGKNLITAYVIKNK